MLRLESGVLNAGVKNLKSLANTLEAIVVERARQDVRWGEQNHPDGTHERNKEVADIYRETADWKANRGTLTWKDIAAEEVWEAFSETDPHRLHEELIQAAAVFTAWAEAVRRR